MYIKRKIEDEILRYLERPEIIAVIGPRQCGKTTTLKKIYGSLKNAVFLTFEDQEALSLFENDIKQFSATYLNGRDYVFIDEFQYAENGGKLLKYLYDTYQGRVKIIISGSSAVDLTIKAVKYLVGRIFIFEMLPFDFEEYLYFRDGNYAGIYKQNKIDLKKENNIRLADEQMSVLRGYSEEYAVWGGYPAVILSKTQEEKREILKNIYNTYFLRDVKDVLGLIDDYKLNRLIKALALQCGQMIEYNELNRISEYSYPTLKKYLNFLQKTYICGFVIPYYKNKRKEIVKNQKVYFFDTGLRNCIVNDFRLPNARPDGGSLLENVCWEQFVKNKHLPQYWRAKNKNEVDFIIDVGEGKMVAIEVKMNLNKCRFPAAFAQNYRGALMYCLFLYGRGEKRKNDLFIPLL